MKFRHLLPSLAVLSLIGAGTVATPALAADTPASAKAAAEKPIERACIDLLGNLQDA